MLIKIINLLNFILPKNNQRVSIISFPDFDDQTRGILNFLDSKEVVILVSKDLKYKPYWLGENVCIKKKNSFLGIWKLLTSSSIFFTHGIFYGFKKISFNRQKIINMWHGMPLKKMGLLDNESVMPDSHYIYSTSKFFQEIMADVFGKKEDDILISGLPRNDILTKPILNPALLSLQKRYENICVWLPTYRKSNTAEAREDGDSVSIFCFENFNANRLNDILVSQNTLVIIKPHPMAIIDQEKFSYSNIMTINEDWLFENELSLYELLGASNMLWTDFSSVFVDYLLKNNPILFLMPDLDSYINNRGLCFDISEINLPGKVIFTQEDFFDSIKSINSIEPCNVQNQIFFNSEPSFNDENLL